MPANVALLSIFERLETDLARTQAHRPATPLTAPDMLGPSFARFGQAAGAAGITLDDTLAAALAAMEAWLGRDTSLSARNNWLDSAGLLLGAVVRAHEGSSLIEASDYSRSTEPFPETQHARLEALHRINRAATSNLQLDEMMQSVVDVVASTTSSDACAIFLYDESSGLLALRAADGFLPGSVGNVTLRMGEGIVGRAAIEGKLIAAPDAKRHESYLVHPGIGDARYASQVSVPMLLQRDRRLVGVLNIHSKERRAFDQDELAFLRTVAGELAIAIENARQHANTDEELRRKVAQLGALQRVSRLFASTLDLNGVLRLITENALAMVDAEAAAVFRPGSATGRARYEPTIESRVGTFRTLKDVQQRDSVVAEVFRTGAARRSSIEYVDGMAQIFCLPLRSARDTVGVLCFRLAESIALESDTLAVVQAFSDSAAIALENALLYRDAMMSIETQQSLVQEMHHRVRNNLQTVAALLSLQLRRSENGPWETELREAISRIQSIAAVHDLLSDEKRLGGTTIDVIARMVAEDAHSTLIPPTLRVRFDIRPSELRIPTKQATIMSLLINELTANAISHGFENRTHGYVRIEGWEEDGYAVVEVFNDGERVPKGFSPEQSEGLGMRITNSLVSSDLKGVFTIRSTEGGTTATMRFPLLEESGQPD